MCEKHKSCVNKTKIIQIIVKDGFGYYCKRALWVYAVDLKNISLPLDLALIFNYKIKWLDFFMVMYFITNSNPISNVRRAAPAICDKALCHCQP